MLSLHRTSCFIPPLVNIKNHFQRLGVSKLHAHIYQQFYGLKSVPVADRIPLEDMLLQAISTLLAGMDIQRDAIQYLIYSHTALTNAPQGYHLIQKVKHRLKLHLASAFSITQNKCASLIDALSVASTALSQQHYAIIVTGDKAFTPQLRSLQNASIVGDMSCAMLVSTHSQDTTILALEKKSYGQYSKGNWLTKEETIQFEVDFLNIVDETVASVLRKLNLDLSQIRWILPHNVNLPIWQKLADKLGYPFSQVYTSNIPRYSHCLNSDFIVNFQSLLDEKKINKGDLILAVMVGFGLTCSAMILRY
jgi:3-oxoacyl-[acyl-carrier-protein] synthase-3